MFSFFLLSLGMVLLVWGANNFVEGASNLAKKLGVPSLIIGLTIVAFGTSAPELAVSISAGLQKANEIVIGNVIGSNLFNLLAVVGISAMIAPLTIERELLWRDWLGTIIAGLLCGFLLLGNNLSRMDGVILLLAFACIFALQINTAYQAKCETMASSVPQTQDPLSPTKSTWIVIFQIVAGLGAIITGGQCAVNGAVAIAEYFNISQTIIGLTIVAIGTSLPELVTSVVATKRGENNIALGNVIGSNLFNILFILGISAVCNPIATQATALFDNLLLLLASTILFLPAYKNQFSKGLGLGMILLYAFYTVWVIIR